MYFFCALEVASKAADQERAMHLHRVPQLDEESTVDGYEILSN